MTELQSILENCLNELKLFKQTGTGESVHCLKLFRIGIQDEDQHAFSLIFLNFHSQVEHWIFAHEKFYITGESVEHFVSVTFSKFYHALQGSKFARMDTFAGVMKYLKLCVHSVITDYLRSLPPPTVNIEDVAIATESKPLDATFDEIWQRILVLITDPIDQLIARKVFVEGYRPAEICEQFSDKFENPRQVSVALQRIRRHLRTDNQLRNLLGIED